MSLGKSDPPPAPDYTGAAVATSAGNADAARIAAKANRVSQYTPYGSVVYSNNQMGDQDQWRSDVSLSPTGQKLLDSQNNISLGLGEIGQQGLGYVQNTLNKPFDWGGLPQAPVNAGTTAQQAIMSRLTPQFNQMNDSFQTRMANQGIAQGSKAYNRAQRPISQQQNDLLLQAALQGINLDTSGRQQAIQEQAFARNEPLNMLNAVRSGSQVQGPQFANAPQQGQTQGPNYFGATNASGQYATDVFNQQRAQEGNTMNGLFSLGAAALPFLMASDRRLKRDICEVGEALPGIGWYSYRYVWDADDAPLRTGVMADEVEPLYPEAVLTGADGFKMVNYGALMPRIAAQGGG